MKHPLIDHEDPMELEKEALSVGYGCFYLILIFLAILTAIGLGFTRLLS